MWETEILFLVCDKNSLGKTDTICCLQFLVKRAKFFIKSCDIFFREISIYSAVFTRRRESSNKEDNFLNRKEVFRCDLFIW